MATAALALRAPSVLRRGSRAAQTCSLAFDRPGEALVAVCALAGGSGASTLANALARQAASESAAPVLLTELGREHATLAALAGQHSGAPLERVATTVAAGEQPARPFVEIEPGLRLLAGPPGPPASVADDALAALLRDGRAAHGLVVVDCGPSWPQSVLDHATHLIWTMPARPAALEAARALVDAGGLPAPGRCSELLVATALDRGRQVGGRALRTLAGSRFQRVVLAPYRPELAAGEFDRMPALVAETLARLARSLALGAAGRSPSQIGGR